MRLSCVTAAAAKGLKFKVRGLGFKLLRLGLRPVKDMA